MVLKLSNFREINIGKIFPSLLFRSNHPICNGRQVDDIILYANNAKIKTIINLSDDIYSIKSKLVYSPWYKGMFEGGNVIALNINMKFDVRNDGFKKRVKDGLLFMIERKPPYLIHCEAGIDRTGFFSIILGALMEAAFDDVVRDYMLSFVDENEYSVNDYNKGSIFLRNLFSDIKGELIGSNENIHKLSKKYLVEDVGLNINEVKKLVDLLMAVF